jgi:hypothetical protein
MLVYLWPFGLHIYYHLVFLVVIWYSITIWYIFLVLVSCTKKNLATLIMARSVAELGIWLEKDNNKKVGLQSSFTASFARISDV